MIKAIAFDFGGVLYTYNHTNLMIKVSNELNLSKERVTKAWNKGIIEFEKSEITEQTFWEIFLSELCLSYDIKKLHELVIEHFQPIEGSLRILNKLKDKLILGLISNQTDWIDELEKKYHFKRLFNIIIISKEVSLRKPQKEIFELFFKKSNVKPEEIIFIDDFLEYKQQVEEMGMKFIHFQTPDKLKKDLNKFNLLE